MMKAYRYPTIIFLTVLLFGKISAQDTTTNNFFEKIKIYDLSTVLTADSILTEDREEGKEMFKRAEILGFIGDNYQRFFIHFISVIQNPTNTYEYFVYGKSKVKETICSFQGTIRVRQSTIYKSVDIPTYKQGVANCDVILYEDKKQSSTGFFKGNLKIKFLIDNKQQFRYDAVMFVADGYCNNQFVGNWTRYKTNASKKCNWGDYQIPDCGDLNIGAGEFSINYEYLKNGWSNYKLAYIDDNQNKFNSKQAKQKEEEQWWK